MHTVNNVLATRGIEAKKAKDTSIIMQQFNSLCDLNTILSDRIKDLETNLQPVLMPDSPSAEGSAPEPPYAVPFADLLNEQCKRLKFSCDRIRDISNRVGI